MATEEDLKRRMRELENQAQSFESNSFRQEPKLEPKVKTKPSRKTSKLLILAAWFLVGIAIVSIVGMPNVYYFIASILLLVSSVSLIAIALASVLPLLLISYIIWSIWNWLK